MMNFIKLVTTFSFFSIILLLVNLGNNQFFQLDTPYFNALMVLFSLYKFSFLVDSISLSFLNMIFPVTMFVLFFSKFYMSWYNNQKFIFILFLFFFSMLILSTSNSALNLMMGWDGLGLSSICLIMFYPNKTSAYNSVLTMFFNRLGDVLMIISLSIILSDYKESLFLSYNWAILLILILCAFSKSAQFPLSSWLPAAMSAPTPISAMVHSSTLVTAGVLLVNKMEMMLMNLNFLLPLMIGSLTFLIGGFLANMEKDFKKVVAFSTMSQISMMMIFCLTIGFWGSMSHMIFHAFFKTSLFCCCGILFISNFSSQNKNLLTSNSSQKTYFFFTFLSIFSMTGLIFSSSFFSKDLFLEEMMYSNFNFFSLVMLVGSLLTLIYCSYIMESLKKFIKIGSISEKKLLSSYSFVFFLMLMMFAPFLTKTVLLMEMFPFMESIETMLITLLFILFTLLKKKFNSNKSKSVSTIFFMKEYTYSLLKIFFSNKNSKETFMSDLIFFKPNLFLMKNKLEVKKFSPTLSLSMAIILTFMV